MGAFVEVSRSGWGCAGSGFWRGGRNNGGSRLGLDGGCLASRRAATPFGVDDPRPDSPQTKFYSGSRDSSNTGSLPHRKSSAEVFAKTGQPTEACISVPIGFNGYPPVYATSCRRDLRRGVR